MTKTICLCSLLSSLLLLITGTLGSGRGQFQLQGLSKSHARRRVTQSCSGQGFSCLDLYDSNGPNSADVQSIVSAQMSNLAYNDSATATDAAKYEFGATNAFTIDNYTSDVHILVATTQNSIMFAFRGTVMSIAKSLATDLKDSLVPTTLAGETVYIHQGFLAAIESVYPDIVSALQSEDPHGQKYLYFTGHSLGAALASLAAAYVQHDQNVLSKVSAVYTFASPRVGDSSWNTIYTSLGLNDLTLRYVYYHDVIPLLPPTDADYVHVGRPIFLSQDYSTCKEIDSQDEWNICGNAVYKFLGDAACTAADAFVSGLGIDVCSGDSNTDQAGCVAVINLLVSGGVTGNLCCDLIQVGIKNGLQMMKVLLSYHSLVNYIDGVQQACASSCSSQRYSTCLYSTSAVAPTPLQVPSPTPSNSTSNLTVVPAPAIQPAPLPSSPAVNLTVVPAPAIQPAPLPSTPAVNPTVVPSSSSLGNVVHLPSSAFGNHPGRHSVLLLFVLFMVAFVHH